MASKKLLEVFKKYEPSEKEAEILNSCTDSNVKIDKEGRLIEVEASFPHLVKKRDLYKIEAEIQKAYDLKHVKFLPHYPSSLFTVDYIPELIAETERVGNVARGFFDDARSHLANGMLRFEIPYREWLLYDAKTNELMQNILRSEFGIKIKVEIVRNEALEAAWDNESQWAPYDMQLVQQNHGYQQEMASKSTGENAAPATATPAAPERTDLIRVPSLYDEDPTPVIEDGIVTIGHTKFDISSPDYKIGEAFEIQPIAIAAIDENPNKTGIVILGEVFAYKAEANRTGDKFNITFGVSDGHSSVGLKIFNATVEESREYEALFKDGKSFALRGYVKKDKFKDHISEDWTFYYDCVAEIAKIGRKDNAPEKRVELHLHTTLSQMDALIPPDVVVKQAAKWGMPAVAITDHGNVQAFPEAMLAADKINGKDPAVPPKIKVIYGIEDYFVNDTAGAIEGVYSGSFEDELISFDIETTGLSSMKNHIIEIGAVRIVGGKVTDKFDTFVDPEEHIPQEITNITSITDEMVAGAPKAGEALAMFFDFIGNTRQNQKPVLLIAHNAGFDTSFIRKAAMDNDMPFPNPYLDTLALSRFINPELKSHRLDKVAEYFNLGDFNHHRACDDAEMLALIFIAMCEKMKKQEIFDFAAMQREMTVNSDPLKLKPYHQIILVKNQVGLKNLYKMVSYSYLNFFKRNPRIPKTILEQHREGLIVGSACEAGELFQAVLENKPEADLEELVGFYDYLEIQPICNNRFMLDSGAVESEEVLRQLNRRIVELGEKYGKPVVATCDAHFLNQEDELYRKILLAGQKFKDADRDTHIYFRTTDEMLQEFAYLGEEKAYEVVVTNTRKIADMVEYVRPIPRGNFPPHMEGADEELQEKCWTRAKAMYGDPLPEVVRARLERELGSIIEHGFAVLYMIAQRLVQFSEEQGYLVGSRGSVGSSLVAHLAGISEVNPLQPHYYCPKCQNSEWFLNGEVGSGFDLPDKKCPKCGTPYKADGHDIMFETFLGFFGDKSPDIDLNFSGDVQGRVHKYTEELFGAENVFRAGTLATLADKTAYGYVLKYLEERGKRVSRSEMTHLVSNCVGVKRTTGQHPGGIIVVPREYEIYDFTPVQHPADDPNSNIVTTHFAFKYIHDTILKLDELGHDIPTKYKWLEKFSNTSVLDVAMNDKSCYELFLDCAPLGVKSEDIGCNVGTLGLPEFGTRFIQQVLQDSKPQNFNDLLKISGLTHGTNVWLGNAQDLIKDGTCDVSRVIGCRDDIMLDMIRYGLPNSVAFNIMEAVRKGKGLTPEWEAEMRSHNVPQWYITSCKKIKYLFPKAHAAAYVMSAIRLAWYKVHIPVAFYCTMFTVAPGGFDAEIVMKGKRGVSNEISRITKLGKEASPKEQDSLPTLGLINEAYARGIRFLPVNINHSDASVFLPENGGIRMPFSALSGLGENAAASIVKARSKEAFFSVEDLQIRSHVTKAVIETLRRTGVLEGLSESDQISMF